MFLTCLKYSSACREGNWACKFKTHGKDPGLNIQSKSITVCWVSADRVEKKHSAMSSGNRTWRL